MIRKAGGLIGVLALLAALAAGCDSSSAGPDPDPGGSQTGAVALPPLGVGRVSDRYTSELWVHGGFAYTGTWGRRGTQSGNVLNVWNVERELPTLVRGVTIGPDTVNTLGDVQASTDGRYLIVATEQVGSLRIFDLASPGDPQLIRSYTSPAIRPGVHTAELATVGGKPYAFLSIDPSPARLVVLDLSDPAEPVEVFNRAMGEPFVHDVFVRDGILFTALWNAGLTIWDIGGGGRGGSPSAPVEMGNVRTAGGQVHNVWWYHAADGGKRYAFVGQEGPGDLGARSRGDIHVVDLSDMSAPKEVAFFTVAGAGTHNFSMDEARGVLFAAYYNGGVRALDVRGDLGACTAAQRAPDGRCDLGLMGREVANWLAGGDAYVWGVQYLNGALFASDMETGLYRLDLAGLPR
jgi:hypothetical protein